VKTSVASVWSQLLQTGYLFKNGFACVQSKLKSIGGSQMEQDYKLVENEGLFQEYLEMGKNLPNNTDILERGYC
jgi:hypothetical protein